MPSSDREETCRGLEQQDNCVHVIPDDGEIAGGQVSQKNVPAFSLVVCSVTFKPLILSATVNKTADFPTPAVPCSQMRLLFSRSSNSP